MIDSFQENGSEPAANGHETLRSIPAAAHAIRDAVRGSSRPVILTHANPDADAVAAALGMRTLVQSFGVEPVLTSSGDAALPSNLEFLVGALDLKHAADEAVAEADLLILVDCSDPSRLGPLFYRMATEFERTRPIINVDHHVTNHRFGTLNLVVPAAASTAEIVVGLFDELGVEIDADTATTLLAGIYGDTLGLRTPSTTPASLRTAAELIEAGADMDSIVDALFRLKPYSTICLWAEALQRAQWRGALMWTQIDPEMLERSGADRTEAEGIVNFLAGTIGARASALLYRESWGWRVSMRSLADDVDVAKLLGIFGGGGHPRAAGARLDAGEDAKERFLNEVAGLLGPRGALTGRASGGDDPV
ncbi:MAG TPA: bifunctional oligoribonuclease/PAP phosphatase NrnA [Thermomicrobiales bacterium]|nr:bifunctional oligoribonuclease/PAP phosphatase NrnA [Thermomicrobiales bacterium]